jgi:hypothetical protein
MDQYYWLYNETRGARMYLVKAEIDDDNWPNYIFGLGWKLNDKMVLYGNAGYIRYYNFNGEQPEDVDDDEFEEWRRLLEQPEGKQPEEVGRELQDFARFIVKECGLNVSAAKLYSEFRRYERELTFDDIAFPKQEHI